MIYLNPLIFSGDFSEVNILNNTEYIKVFWNHDYLNEPRVIIYEVDLKDNRYILRLIDIYDAVIEVLPLETVKEINNGIWGEEISACLISREEFEEIWNTHIYNGSLE